jgi:hypothetical protein
VFEKSFFGCLFFLYSDGLRCKGNDGCGCEANVVEAALRMQDFRFNDFWLMIVVSCENRVPCDHQLLVFLFSLSL